jgi:hypothetical protein
LKLEKDGSKSNRIQLNEVPSADVKAIGNYLIRLYRTWKPKTNAENPKELGELYGFKLYIRHEKDLTNLDGKSMNNEYNSLYAERPDGTVRYTFSSGAPNTDNPKLAARYFLNAIDKVDSLVEKYQKDIKEMEGQLPQLQGMLHKPFEKEAELQQMKSELSRLEREIAQKIREKQEQQQLGEQAELNAAAGEGKNEPNKEAVIIDIDAGEAKKPIEQWAEQIVAEGKILKERTEQVFKKTKGVKI